MLHSLSFCWTFSQTAVKARHWPEASHMKIKRNVLIMMSLSTVTVPQYLTQSCTVILFVCNSLKGF